MPREKMIREIARIRDFLGNVTFDCDFDAMNDYQIEQTLDAARNIRRRRVEKLKLLVAAMRQELP